MRRLVVSIAVLIAVLTASAQAKFKPVPNSWLESASLWQIQLDTQPGVVNTTGCPWNDQDYQTWLGVGYVDGTATKTTCLVADFDDQTKGSAVAPILPYLFIRS